MHFVKKAPNLAQFLMLRTNQDVKARTKTGTMAVERGISYILLLNSYWVKNVKF